MKVKLRLDTVTDVKTFVEAVSGLNEIVEVKDNAGHCVSAKSLMGMLYSLEWSEIWCECENDIYHNIEQFVI